MKYLFKTGFTFAISCLVAAVEAFGKKMFKKVLTYFDFKDKRLMWIICCIFTKRIWGQNTRRISHFIWFCYWEEQITEEYTTVIGNICHVSVILKYISTVYDRSIQRFLYHKISEYFLVFTLFSVLPGKHKQVT